MVALVNIGGTFPCVEEQRRLFLLATCSSGGCVSRLAQAEDAGAVSFVVYTDRIWVNPVGRNCDIFLFFAKLRFYKIL